MFVTVTEKTAQAFAQTQDDVTVMLPQSHVGMTITILLTTLCAGGTMVVASGMAFEQFMEALSRGKVTVMLGLPFTYLAITNMTEEDAKRYDLSSLRLCLLAGGSLPIEIIKKFKQMFGGK